MSDRKDKAARVIDAVAEEKQRRDEVMQAALVPHQPVQTPDSLPIAMSDIKDAFGFDYPISLLNDVGGSGALPVGHLGLAPTPDPVKLSDYVKTPIDIVDQDWVVCDTKTVTIGRQRGLCWAGDRWVIGTDLNPSEFIWSYDGLSWQAGGICPVMDHRTYSLEYNGKNIIAVSSVGYMLPLISSDKGATWRVATGNNDLWKGALSCGVNENFAVSIDDGYIHCSSDYGETWTDYAIGLSMRRAYFINWAKDRWLSVDRAYSISFSMDPTGQTGWTASSPFPELIYSIAYNPKDGVLLAGSGRGTVYRITDLDNMGAYTTHAPFDGLSTTARIEEITWTGKEFLLVIRNTGEPLYHSLDGINWSQNDKAIGSLKDVDQTAFIDHGWGTTQFMISGASGAFMTPST